MAVQLQITVREMPHSEALEAEIRRKAAGLERVHPRIIAIRATVEAPHHHKRNGNPFSVKLDIRIPGGEIVVNGDHPEDAYAAMRDAFQTARRQLVAHVERAQTADKVRRSRGRGAPAAGESADE